MMNHRRENPPRSHDQWRLMGGLVAAAAALALGACTGGPSEPAPATSAPTPAPTPTSSVEVTMSPSPTDLPPVQVLENSEVPTSGSRDGAVQLAEFYLRETTAVLSGADPTNLQSVCDAECSHCAQVLSQAATIDSKQTHLAFAAFQGGSTTESEGIYSVRAQAVQQPGVLVTKAGESTPINGGTIILDLKATFDDAHGWTIQDARISSYEANEQMPMPGVTPQ